MAYAESEVLTMKLSPMLAALGAAGEAVSVVGHFVYCAVCRLVTKLADARQLPNQSFICKWCDQ